jgi:hypothetical protein
MLNYIKGSKSKEHTKENIAYYLLQFFCKFLFSLLKWNLKNNYYLTLKSLMLNLKGYYDNQLLNKRLVSMFKRLFDNLG